MLVLVLAGALALIVALSLGWNSPRPTSPPDWEAPGLPLYLKAPQNETATSLLYRPSSDFTLEVEAIPLSGPDFNGYGLVYRAQGPAQYYAFTVGGDGYYAVLRVAGNEETSLVEWQQFPHVHRGREANRLRVACGGPTCHFYVNDEYATTIEDDTWLTGDVGLWVRSFEDGNVAVQFVNMRVWEVKEGLDGGSVEEMRQAKGEMMEKFYRMLCIHLGQPPSRFLWEWRDKDKKFHRHGEITPTEFLEQYVDFDLDELVCLINAPTQDKPYRRLYTVQYLGNVVGGQAVRYLNVDMETLKKATADMIVDGQVKLILPGIVFCKTLNETHDLIKLRR